LLLDDIEAFGPTVFAGVPRLYNRLFDKINAAMDSAGGLKKALFNRAYAAKSANLAATGQLTHALWDRLVFSKIAAKLGGRCRLMVTGSAPIAANVMAFLRVCFSCAVVEGYGQTEGAAAATTTLVSDQSQAGTVGVPLCCVEIKLVDVPEMGYTSKDVSNGVPTPRGEIWVRGSAVFAGYYKDAERTKEALQDQWLLSGDIAMWTPDGQLKIVDRKKNIFKLAQGEYIAPEKIENIYGRAKYMAQIYVHGNYPIISYLNSLYAHMYGMHICI
jgi:long-chain acyl-CoA synthetase